MKVSRFKFALSLLIFSFTTYAESYEYPTHGFFFGLGGGYNSENLKQNFNITGNSNVYNNTTLVAYGKVGGLLYPESHIQPTFAPEAQLGYFHHFPNQTGWGWQFAYKYFGITSINHDLAPLETSVLNNTIDAPANTIFNGNVVVDYFQTNVTHETAFLIFIGECLSDFSVYLGAGPSIIA